MAATSDERSSGTSKETDDACTTNEHKGCGNDSFSTTETTPTSNLTTTSNERRRKCRKRLWPFLWTPYLLGLIWHGLHPMMSVLTGDFSHPRRSYIDENSLDPNQFKWNINYPLIKTLQDPYHATTSSLCETLQSKQETDHIPCRRHGSIEIVTIIPSGTAVAPVGEVLVIVLPYPQQHDDSSRQFQSSILHLMRRLSSPYAAPWLAKTVLFVAPHHDDKSNITSTSLTETVDAFLEFWQRSDENSLSSDDKDDLLLVRGAIIRNLLVVDALAAETGATNSDDNANTNELLIMPQGRQGLLPNMDLVFLCTNIYGRPHNMFQQRISTSTHRSKLQQAWEKSLIHRWLPSFGHNHVDQLLDLWNFQYILAFGPVPPHASALGQGIDALTIQLRTSSSSSASQHDVTRLVAGLEYILRALSNLHERLHHSTSLYLLLVGPSTPEDAFVKHEEYLISNILLLVPCILRAVSFVFGKTDGHGNNSSGKHSFCWATAQRAVWSTLTATVVLGMITLPQLATAVSPVGGRWRTMHNAVKTLIVLSYVPLLLLLQHTSFRWSLPDGRPVSLPTLQFVGCLLVIYTHVPLAFAHVSVGFPSAMFWSLLMAFPSYDCVGKDGDTMVAATTTKPSKLLRYAAIVLSCPAALLLLFLPANVMSNSVYLRYVYLPLHYLLAQLWQH